MVARHAPRGAGGREAALIDIAQDILLAHLGAEGLFEFLVFKGGTALRKVYSGVGGRFSTDLDFSLRSITDDRGSAVALLAGAIDGHQTEDFSYGVQQRRGKWAVTYRSRLGEIGALTSKLDVGPPVWLEPTDRSWVPAPVHSAYAVPQSIPTMALKENIAEKIARLNRRTPARDLYDLWWIGRTHPHSKFNEAVARRLAILKCWVDTFSLHCGPHTWHSIDDARPFDPVRWLAPRARRDFDDESIGLLVNPPPSLPQLSTDVSARFAFLADMADDEKALCAGGPGLRAEVLSELARLDGGLLAGATLF